MEDKEEKVTNIKILDSKNEDERLYYIKKWENQTQTILSSLQLFIEENDFSFYVQYPFLSAERKFFLNNKISEYINILITSDITLIKKVDIETILNLYDSEQSISNKLKILLSFNKKISEKFKNEIKIQYEKISVDNQKTEK